MRRVKWHSLLYFILALLCICNIPKSTTQKARFFFVGAFSPSWEMCSFLKEKLGAFFSSSSFSYTEKERKELETLKRENLLLRIELENVKEWLLHEDRIEEQMQRLAQLQKEEGNQEALLFYKRRQAQAVDILKLQMKALPAKVVYREPCSWSSFFWINVGEKQNKALEEEIVAKNSPVVIGNVLIGFIEEVGLNRSKVRLLTDSKFVPAVRAVRGSEQNYKLIQQIESVLQIMQTRQELFTSEEEAVDLFEKLQKVSFRAGYFSEDFYLAKGELYGSALPLWRSRGQLLQGVGFNYDFPDEEGPARDLRTGEPLSEKKGKSIPLLRVGDLLITSGLDGLFPPGFEVAIVKKIQTLQEGSSSYEITAKTLVEDLNEIRTVFVLPPLGQ